MRVVLILFAWLLQSPFQGWETLSRLELVSGFDDFLGEETEVPFFSEELKGFEGEIVTIEGYVIPLQTSREGDFFVLSRFPYNNCFFCGNAGPETVAEIYTKDKVATEDSRVRVTGRLELNANDPLHLFFILSEARVTPLD
jgi:hypothetical protein